MPFGGLGNFPPPPEHRHGIHHAGRRRRSNIGGWLIGCLAVLFLIGVGTIGGLTLLFFAAQDEGQTTGFLQDLLAPSAKPPSSQYPFASLEEMMQLDGAAAEDLELVAPLDFEKVDERAANGTPVMHAATEDAPQAEAKQPERRLLEHPTRPLRLDVPQGYAASLTIAGAYLYSDDVAVELAWLSLEEHRELPPMSEGSRMDGWRVTSSRSSRQVLSSGLSVTLIEASAVSEDGSLRALIRADLLSGGGTVVLGTEGDQSKRSLLKDQVLRVASEIEVPTS